MRPRVCGLAMLLLLSAGHSSQSMLTSFAKSMLKSEGMGRVKGAVSRLFARPDSGDKAIPEAAPKACALPQAALSAGRLAEKTAAAAEAEEQQLEERISKTLEDESALDFYFLLATSGIFRKSGLDKAQNEVAAAFLRRMESSGDFRERFYMATKDDQIFVEFSYMLMYIAARMEQPDHVFAKPSPDSVPFIRRALGVRDGELHEALRYFLTGFYERDTKSIKSILAALGECTGAELETFFTSIYPAPFQKRFPGFLEALLRKDAGVDGLPMGLINADLRQPLMPSPARFDL